MSLGMGLFDLLMRFQMQVLNGLVQKLYVLIIARPPFFVFFCQGMTQTLDSHFCT